MTFGFDRPSEQSRRVSGQSHTLHLITCEYPPDLGGVSDFTRVIAEVVAQTGRTVHVWAPGASGTSTEAFGVVVHREFGTFRAVDRQRVSRLLDRCDPERTLFLQWVPHGYGARSMNLGICFWLVARVRNHSERLEVMIHEPFLPWRGSSVRVKFAAAVQRLMMALLLRASSATWVSTTAWIPIVGALGIDVSKLRWLPVPSPFPVQADHGSVPRLRRKFSVSGGMLIGNMGTFGETTFGLLSDAIRRIARAHPTASFLLIGRGSTSARDQLLRASPVLGTRVHATGTLSAADMSRHMQACDMMIQPYPDGATCRRTSLVAAMAHGLPIVTTSGALTESIWASQDALELVSVGDSDAFAARTAALIENPERRAVLGTRAAAMYEAHLSAGRAVELLTAQSDHVHS